MKKVDMQLIAIGLRVGLKAALKDIETGKIESAKLLLNGSIEALEGFGEPSDDDEQGLPYDGEEHLR